MSSKAVANTMENVELTASDKEQMDADNNGHDGSSLDDEIHVPKEIHDKTELNQLDDQRPSDHGNCECPETFEKPSSVVPVSLTVNKDVSNLQLIDEDDQILHGVDLDMSKSSHIKICLQEDKGRPNSDNATTQHALETDMTDSRILNIEVSCNSQRENSNPNADKDTIFATVYSCNKCTFCTSKLGEMKLHTHTEQHENEEETDEDISEHVEETDDTEEDTMSVQYACNNCSFKTQRFHTYREHLLTHAKIGAKEMFKCMDCDYTTRLKYNLKTHLKRHAKLGELCDDEVFRCKKCDYVSPYKHDLMTHVKKHDPEKPFQCDQCKFQSIYKHSLIHHKRSKHERLRPFKCDECDYSSARKQDLQTHMGRHAEEKKFQCDRCSYATPYRVSFKAHMDRHMGNKVYKCEQQGCDFATTTKQNLKSHELRHSTVKPLKCVFCDYTASHKQQMLNHELKHSVTDPPSKTFQCPTCDYRTSHRYSLQRHMNRHKTDRKMPDKNYTCNECGYQTAYKNSLKRHMAKHSDVKPFKCGHCDYSAINMTQMHVHIAKHTGIKPFKCDICDYATANKQHLVGHMAKHSSVRLICTKCNFATAWKQRFRTHLKAHETGKLFQKKDQNDGSVQTGKIMYVLPGSAQHQDDEAILTSESNDALNEISNAIQTFHSYSLQGEVEISSSPPNRDKLQENGNTSSSDDEEEGLLSQHVDGAGQEKTQTEVEEVQLIDEDGNQVSAAVQCINGKQSIEVLVDNGIKKRVALKDLQKDGSQVFVWEQSDTEDSTVCMHAASPSKPNAELENETTLLVIDEMKGI